MSTLPSLAQPSLPQASRASTTSISINLRIYRPPNAVCRRGSVMPAPGSPRPTLEPYLVPCLPIRKYVRTRQCSTYPPHMSFSKGVRACLPYHYENTPNSDHGVHASVVTDSAEDGTLQLLAYVTPSPRARTRNSYTEPQSGPSLGLYERGVYGVMFQARPTVIKLGYPVLDLVRTGRPPPQSSLSRTYRPSALRSHPLERAPGRPRLQSASPNSPRSLLMHPPQ